MERLQKARVIVFGVGGVGSWCAESLVRSGVGHLTVVDSDRVCVTNINRQSMATSHTVGMVKVEALRQRLLEIAPGADVKAVQEIYSAETAHLFPLQDFDYIVDAIDSLSNKLELVVRASSKELYQDTGRRPVLLSAMGAALKMDPTAVRVTEFWDIDGCPLAAALRHRMRKTHRFPGRKFRCVWSPEVLPNRGSAHSCGTSMCVCPKGGNMDGRADLADHEWCTSKAQINGSMAHMTAIMGFTLAGLAVSDIVRGM